MTLPRVIEKLTHPRVVPAAGALALFWLGIWITWRLYFNEYTEHFGSVEPFFYTIARAIRTRWPDLVTNPGWWPAWNTGVPFSYTYQPLLHALVAGVAALTGWSEPRAYHFTIGVMFAVGPAAVYLLLLRLTRRPGVSFLGGLLYTFFSPSAVLVPKIAGDMGGWWYPRRLFAGIVWGDAPNVVGLALLPLAILLLDRALERRTPGAYLAAAVGLAIVPLTNIPASMALAIAVGAYALAIDWRRWRDTWPRIAGVGALGFALFAPWLPPSGFSLAAANVQWMNRGGQFGLGRLGYYLGIAAAVAIGCVILQRLRAPVAVRFAALFSLVLAPVVLAFFWAGVELIGQADRFHLAMDLGLVLLLASAIPAGIRWTRWPRWVRVAGAVLLVASCAVQWDQHRYFVRRIVRQFDATDRSEYRIAQWMDQNAAGRRVYVAGSTAFWFNHWTDTPQVHGCCDQNMLTTALPAAIYVIGSDDGAGDRGAEISIAWLEVLGARFVAVSGPVSTDVYKDFRHWQKFDGLLTERWRMYDDVIYEVPQASDSLAHAVRPEELVARMPENGLDIAPLEPYRAAIEDAARPEAAFAWVNTHEAVIHGTLPEGWLYSVQIPYHAGWRAEADGSPAAVGRDGIGFLTLRPECSDCEVRLTFDGGTEARLLRVAAIVAWIGVIFWMVWRRVRVVES